MLAHNSVGSTPPTETFTETGRCILDLSIEDLERSAFSKIRA